MAKINPVELQKALKGTNYPAKKQDLVAAVESNGASDQIRKVVGNMPDTTYETPADVTQQVDFSPDSQ